MLTVLLATRNGASILGASLASYLELTRPPGDWKLVVVDNGSDDATRTIIDSFRGRLPLTYLCESRPGKNVALNTGLEHVAGDLVVFTDDDVFPRADWLVQLRTAADAHGADYAVFAGTVLPRWEAPPPQWILRCVPAGPVFTLSDPAVDDGPTGAHNVFGPNMAIRAAILAGGVRFDAAIGPRHGSYAMGSETELVRRLQSAGYKAWFVRDAVVEHFIRKTQLEERWILNRAVRFGRGQYRMALPLQAPAKLWRGIPRYLFRQLLQHLSEWARAACRLDRTGRFRARWDLNYVRGQILEATVLHRAATAGPGTKAS